MLSLSPGGRKYSPFSHCQIVTHFRIIVDKQHKYAVKQASFVFQRFTEQLVVDVDFTGLTFDIGIKRDILDQFKAHLTGKLLHIGVLFQTFHEQSHIFLVLSDRGKRFFKLSDFNG